MTTNLSWRSFGGINQYEKNSHFNNVTIDNLVLKSPYYGIFSISGELNVSKNTYFYANCYINGNCFINKNCDISGNCNIYKNCNINKNLYVNSDSYINGNLIVTGAIELSNNVVVSNSLYVNNNIFLSGHRNLNGIIEYKSAIYPLNENIGINTINPTSVLDISGGINTIKMISSNVVNINVLSQNSLLEGTVFYTGNHKNSIQFYGENKIPYINISNAVYLNNSIIEKGNLCNSSITYSIGGNILIDVSNNSIIHSNVTIGKNAKLNDLNSHILNESLIVYDVSNMENYLYNYYNIPQQTYNSGNGITIVSDNSNSNTFLNIITPNKKGFLMNGGSFISDNNRSFGSMGVYDVCGEYFPLQTFVSGNLYGDTNSIYKATIGINTFSPKTDKYIMSVNGKMNITNDQIETVLNTNFTIKKIITNKLSVCAFGNYIINENTSLTTYDHIILYSDNGGITWKNSTIHYSAINNFAVNFNSGYYLKITDISGLMFVCGDNGYLFFSNNNGKNWYIFPGIVSNGSLSDDLISMYVSPYYVSNETTLYIISNINNNNSNRNIYSIKLTNNDITNLLNYNNSGDLSVIDIDGVVNISGVFNKYEISDWDLSNISMFYAMNGFLDIQNLIY